MATLTRVQPIESAVTGTERAIFGLDDVADILRLLDDYLSRAVGSHIEQVLFRSGRIDAVWAVQAADGRKLAVKAYRQPVDIAARAATATAQRSLAAAGFPCPTPVVDPAPFDTLVLGAETLLMDGVPADGRDPSVRRVIAEGLARCIEILRPDADLKSRVGPAPAWSQYGNGAWPPPHDPIFDFRFTPRGFKWLDAFAGAAATQLTAADRTGLDVVVGHADWCCGNLRFDGARLVAAFDWDLVADVESVIVGLAAGGYPGGESDADTSSPEDVRAFLIAYDALRVLPFDSRERRMAAAAAWVVAYNARCQLSLLVDHPGLAATLPGVGPTVDMLRARADDYLHLDW